MQVSKASTYAGFECTKIENDTLALWVTTTVGPRIIGLQLTAGNNLFAELPDATIECPGVGEYQLRGGHRLWHAPEEPGRTYLPDDDPLQVAESAGSIKFTQPVEPQTGVEKSIVINLPDQQAQVMVEHHLKNCGSQTVELAAWAITQLKPGGVAVLPQVQDPVDEHGLLPNRQIALWPYTDAGSQYLIWGDRFIFIQSRMEAGALKIGYPNPSGWIGYLQEKTLFIKKAAFLPDRSYYDFHSSSECYCNPFFLELETLGPRTRLEPGESLSHLETWHIYDQVDIRFSEASVIDLIEKLGL
jgi:hypothetical protein